MNTILVPSDLSANAAKALEYAIALSKKINASLVIYHCLLRPPMEGDEERRLEELKTQADNAYRLQGFDKTPETTKIIIEFHPMKEESILETANAENANLIVMGTQGSTGLEKLFLGSVTSTIISKSDIPVLAVPENFNGSLLQNIVFCSDLENIETELKELLPLIRGLEGNLKLVYFDYGTDPEHKLLKNAEEIIQKPAPVSIELIVQPASIEYPLNKQIKEYIENTKADCLVMFTKERSIWDRLFNGSKTVDISESLAIPLLSFKRGKAGPGISF